MSPETLVWSPEAARATRGWQRVLMRLQAFLYFPLLTVTALNLHGSSVRARSRSMRGCCLRTALGTSVRWLLNRRHPGHREIINPNDDKIKPTHRPS